MGSMISSDPMIDELWFTPFPTKPITMSKVVRVGQHLYGLGKSKQIYTTSRLAENICYSMADWGFLDDVMKALLRLGVITKDQAIAHTNRVKEVCDQRDLKYDQETVDRILKKHGTKIKLNGLKTKQNE